MGSSLIGQLRIMLGMETTQLESGARRAKTELKGIAETAKEVKGLLSTLVGAFALEALKETVQRSLEHVEALGKQAKALGVTTAELQEYRYAASQAGVSNETFFAGVAKLSKSLGDARNGAEAPKKAFAALSTIIGHDLTAGTANALQILPALSDGLMKIQDPARRASLEAQLFKKGWQEMAPFLALGSEKINQLRAAAHELGIVLSEEQIQNAEATAYKLKSLSAVLGARIDGAVAANAKAIYGLADALSSMAGSLAQWWAKDPRGAAGILAGMAGFRMGGPVGGAVGLIGGVLMTKDTPLSLRARAHENQLLAQNRFRHLYGDPKQYSPEQRHDLIEKDFKLRTLRTYFAGYVSEAAALEKQTPMAPDTATGTATPGQFLAPSHTGRKKRDDSEQRAKEAERIKYEFDKLEIDGKRQMLEAQKSLTVNAEDREKISAELLQVDHDQKALEIQHRLRMVQLDKTVSAGLKKSAEQTAQKEQSLNDQLLLLNKANLGLQQRLDQERDLDESNQGILRAQDEKLRLEEEMARTAGERRTIELEMLRLAYEERKRQLKAIINDDFTYTGADGQPHTMKTHSDKDIAAASLELYGNPALGISSLDAKYGRDQAKAMRATMGPLEQLRDSIPDTAARMNEALEEVAANGLKSMTDGLAEASASWIKMGGVAGQILRTLYQDIMKILIMKYLERPAANALSGLFGHGLSGSQGSALNDVFGNIGAGDGGIFAGLDGFATGGSIMIGGMSGIDTNLLSINNSPIARVSQGERLDIVPKGNDRGGGQVLYFDLSGAVVTEDLVRKMNEIGETSAMRGAVAGRAMTLEHLQKMKKRSLG